MIARVCLVVVLGYAAATAIRLAVAGKATIASVSLLALVAAPAVLGLWRGAIVRVVAEEAGVRVVNVTRTHFISWEDIRRFSVGPLNLLPKVGIVELRNGDQLGIFSIQGPNPTFRPNNTNAEKLIEALNGELARHASSGTTSPTN